MKGVVGLRTTEHSQPGQGSAPFWVKKTPAARWAEGPAGRRRSWKGTAEELAERPARRRRSWETPQKSWPGGRQDAGGPGEHRRRVGRGAGGTSAVLRNAAEELVEARKMPAVLVEAW